MRTIFVRDEIIPGFNDKCRVIPAGGTRQPARVNDADMARAVKALDMAIAALEADYSAGLNARITAARNRPIPDHEGAGLNPWQMAAQRQPSADEMNRRYAANQARICAESEAAYAARNPHKRKEGTA